jgi:hypothetical protein
MSPKFLPIRSRVLGCRHAHRNGVSLFGRALAQPGSSLAAEGFIDRGRPGYRPKQAHRRGSAGHDLTHRPPPCGSLVRWT